MLKRLIAVAVVLVVAAGATSLFAQAATNLAGEALLRALLDELRTFRTTMQRNSAYELRGRLLIDRARLHQETIRELSREVENSADFMRTEMTEISFEMDPEFEARASAIANPDERKRMLERHKEAMEKRKELEARHREQMRMRFQRMESRLGEEREKLRAIEEELAEIQKELTGASPAPSR